MDFEKIKENAVEEAPKQTFQQKKLKPVFKYKVTINPKMLLNVRSTPELGDNVIGSLKPDTELISKAKVGSFIKFDFNGKDAYVMESKLTRI